jgi:hypothetical protein
LIIGQSLIEDVELTLYFHSIAVNRVFILLRGIGIKMTKTASEKRNTANIPK